MDTFVIRLWVDPDDSGRELAFAGVVEHVRSGAYETFHDARELIGCIRALAGHPAGEPRRQRQ